MQFDIEMKIIGNPFDVWQCLMMFILSVTFPLDFAFKLMRATRKIKNEIIWLNGEFFPKNKWTSDIVLEWLEGNVSDRLSV